MGALLGITLGAAGIPQVSLAIEAFSNARMACSPTINVMGRKLEKDMDDTTRTKASSKSVSCSTLATNLPKYEIDSSCTDGRYASSLTGEICFNDVSFSYPSRPESLVFDNFALKLNPGQTVGVCGPSGSGVSQTLPLLVLCLIFYTQNSYPASYRKAPVCLFFNDFMIQ